MGNLVSSQDSEQLDKLGKLTLPVSSIWTIGMGTVLIASGVAMQKLIKEGKNRLTVLAGVGKIQCPAKNFCLVDLQWENELLQAVPIHGVWNLGVGDKLWVSYQRGKFGQPIPRSARVIMDPTPENSTSSNAVSANLLWLLFLFMGIVLLVQGAIKLFGNKFGVARKLNSAGFFASP